MFGGVFGGRGSVERSVIEGIFCSHAIYYSIDWGLVAGVGVIFEALLDDGEVGLVLADDVEEVGVFRALFELGDEGDEEGNLELDLVRVDTVENAV